MTVRAWFDLEKKRQRQARIERDQKTRETIRALVEMQNRSKV